MFSYFSTLEVESGEKLKLGVEKKGETLKLSVTGYAPIHGCEYNVQYAGWSLVGRDTHMLL